MFNWGIVSAASIAASFMNGIKTSQNSRAAAVAARDLKRARAFADKYGIPKAYGSYRELMEDPEIDGVYVCNLHPWHREAALMAAAQGKHILVEKPAFMNKKETEEVIAACRKNGVFFLEAFMYRCHPQTRAACDVITSGRLGEVHFIRTSFGFDCPGGNGHRVMDKKVGGGGILDVGCYNASLARLFAGCAQGRPFADPVSLRATGYLGETGADYISSAAMSFENGLQAVMSCAIKTQLPNDALVCGTEGSMLVENPWGGAGRIIITGRDPGELRFEAGGKNLYSYEIDYVAQQSAPWPAMSPEDTLGNMETLDMWRKEIGLEYGPAGSIQT
ncbi:MAG: Gfo/Idh/MocA family oxidoreductase [Abditibacteriota bacterium]|nr:Gfo/Idh/MocA family oxidoreductase [Abditibacteriota bacterium]